MCALTPIEEKPMTITVKFKYLKCRDFTYNSWYERLCPSKDRHGILFWTMW